MKIRTNDSIKVRQDDLKKNKLRNRDKSNKIKIAMEHEGKKKKNNESWNNFKEKKGVIETRIVILLSILILKLFTSSKTFVRQKDIIIRIIFSSHFPNFTKHPPCRN